MLIIENGTGIAGANSYVSLEDSDTYFISRLNDAWFEKTIEQKESALIKSCAYIEARYSEFFIGVKAYPNSTLSWPRRNAASYQVNEIPSRLKYAQFEYALRAVDGPLAPDPAVSGGSEGTFVSKEKVGPLEVNYSQMTSGTVISSASSFATDGFRAYPEADMWIIPLLRNKSRTYR